MRREPPEQFGGDVLLSAKVAVLRLVSVSYFGMLIDAVFAN